MSVEKSLNIVWEKCHHGIEKRHGCLQCEEEKRKFLKSVFERKAPFAQKRIPILRGCNSKDGCFCTGRCNEVIGYRDPLPGEHCI